MKYYNISVNGVAYSVSVEETAAGAAPVAPAAAPAPKAAPAPAAAAAPAAPAAPASAGAVEVKAPMPGNILDVNTVTSNAIPVIAARTQVLNLRLFLSTCLCKPSALYGSGEHTLN